MIWFVAACVVPACLVSWGVTALMRVVAPRVGLVDQPAARKVHSVPTPLGGGLGIYCGFVIPVLIAQGAASWLWDVQPPPGWLPAEMTALLPGLLERGREVWLLVGAGTLLTAMGLLDDLRPLPWQPRLLLQFLIAAALAAGGVRATLFVEHPWIGAVLTVLWIVVLINSLNFLDNMDALAGGIGLIVSVIFAVVMLTSTGEPRWLVGGALLLLAGSLGGFLIHNRPPAKIFMGDSGSTFLGMMLASLTVLGTFYDERLPSRHVILAPLCVLAVPLYDTATVLWIRLREGRSPFQPDKCHFSHRLVELGLSRAGAVRTVHLCTLTTGLGALLLYSVPGWTGALVIVTLVLCVLAIINVLETAARRTSNNSSTSSSPAEPSSPDPTSA